MSAGIIIGILAFLAFLAFIGYSIYSITSDTICDSSKCISPGGNWLKDKCTCSCNPGYSGVNCQTKSKHVSDLETACKDKTGKDCSSCLKTNIAKKLSGNASDVQQFKDDFTSSITAINNICCPKNCSNTSGTACDNCVSVGMKNLSKTNQKLNTSDRNYLINDKGCFSYLDKSDNKLNFIGKTSVCSDSESSTKLQKCPITAGQVNKCSDVNNQSVQNFKDRYPLCNNLLSNEKEICTVNSQKTSCISSKKKCMHPNDPDGKLYGSDKCNNNGFYDSNKCQCPGMTNPNGWVGGGGSDISWYDPGSGKYHGPIIFYADDNSKCKTTCKQQGNPTKKLAKGCPCGMSSPDCGNNLKCGGDTRSNSVGRKCQ
jgi:hypothetical protein